MSVRTFELVTDRRLAQTTASLQAALLAWVDVWRPDPLVASALVVSRHDAAGADTRDGWLTGEAQGAFVWSGDAGLAVLAEWLFDDPAAAHSGIARDVAADALRDLLHGLLGDGAAAVPLTRAPLPEGAGLAGNAVVDIGLSIGARSWHVIARLPSTPAASATPHHAEPLARLPSALLGQTVSLSATLDDVEIDLRTLGSLAQGDVIRFGARLDQPLSLFVDGQPLHAAPRAYLGMVGGHRALEIFNSRKAS